MVTQLLLSVDEAAQALGIGRSQLYELMMASHVESVKIGKRRLVIAASLDEYIERLRSAWYVRAVTVLFFDNLKTPIKAKG
jgi:excisionase family DNA binding protein